MAKEKALEVAWRSGHKKLGALCSFMSALDGTGQKILGEPRSLPESGLWDMTFANQEAVQTLVGSLRQALLPQTFSQGEQLLAVTIRGGRIFGFFLIQTRDFFELYEEFRECDRVLEAAAQA